MPDMPVDGVLVGTAAMTAKEAHTSPQVKKMLVETPGITDFTPDPDPFAPRGEKWVPSGKAVGGVTSGLSHLHADIYELENSSARCGRLLVRVMKHPEELDARRDEIIEALNTTAKPYFGDLKDMTYLEWAERFAELSFPWADWTYAERFLHLLQRIEARVCSQESGELDSLFADRAAVESDPQAAIAKLRAAYPQAVELKVTAADVAWFPTLVREFPKPMPFVPVIQRPAALVGPGSAVAVRGRPLLRRFRAHHPRPDLRGRHHHDGRADRRHPRPLRAGRHQARQGRQQRRDHRGLRRAGRLRRRRGVHPQLCPNISWVGHLMANPAYGTANGDEHYEIRHVGTGENGELFDLDIHLDTYWDNDPDGGLSKHAVRDIVIPLVVNGAESGLFPVVDRDRLPEHVYAMLAATAGIGNTAITGDELTAMPVIEKSADKTARPSTRCSPPPPASATPPSPATS